MIRVNTHSSGLSQHMSVYSYVDARLDNPHLPGRELGTVVREARGLSPNPLPRGRKPARRRLRELLGEPIRYVH